jgi:hypothetical protein
MRRLYCLALDVGVTVTLATGFVGGWIAVTGTYQPPLWANALAGTAVMGVAWLLEEAVTVRSRARRRAHARTHPTKPRKAA